MNAARQIECRHFEQWLTPYIDGELDAVHAIEVEAHLESCEICSEQVALTRATRGSLRRLGQVRAPAALRERIVVSLQAEAAARTEPARPHRAALAKPQLVKLRYILPLAAAACFALVLGAMQARQATVRGNPELASAPSVEQQETQRTAASLDNLLEELVLQHAHAVEPELTDPQGLERFEPYLGVRVRTPQLQAAGGRYVGARMTSRAAMLQYIFSNRHRVSLYVFNPEQVPLKANTLAPKRVKAHDVYVGKVRGYSVAASERSGVGYALASDLSDEKNAELLLLASR